MQHGDPEQREKMIGDLQGEEIAGIIEETNFSDDSQAYEGIAKTNEILVRELGEVQNEIDNLQTQMKSSSKIQWRLTGAIVFFSIIQVVIATARFI